MFNMRYHKGYGFKMTKQPPLPEIREKEPVEGYDYSEDFENCIHRPKIYEIKPKWETGTAELIIECKDCSKLATVDGTYDYDDEEVDWQ
jgi:hypothetical protein